MAIEAVAAHFDSLDAPWRREVGSNLPFEGGAEGGPPFLRILPRDVRTEQLLANE